MPLTIADSIVDRTDIDTAVTRDVISAGQRDTILAIARERRRAAAVIDDEQLRLVTSFNDIFVTLAILVLLGGLAALAITLAQPLAPPSAAVVLAAAGIAAAATCWGLAEYFTRMRRMALPSIVLLGAFVVAAGFTAFALGAFTTLSQSPAGSPDSLPESTLRHLGLLAFATGAAAAYMHWRRFHVPITIAAGAATLVGFALLLLDAATPNDEGALLTLAALCGLLVFALAMRFDLSDPRRETRRSDIAFWLHLLAAPLIVHPIMSALGLFGADPSPAIAGVVLALYLAFTFVALAIDRRALLVSALGYVIYAINALLDRGVSADFTVPLTAFVIGLFLVSLSAVWPRARAALLTALPGGLAGRLPLPATA